LQEASQTLQHQKKEEESKRTQYIQNQKAKYDEKVKIEKQKLAQEDNQKRLEYEQKISAKVQEKEELDQPTAR
jgi:hypothetical protein